MTPAPGRGNEEAMDARTVKLLLVADARHTARKVDRFKAACSLAGARFSRLAVRVSSGGGFGSTVGAGRSK